MPSVTDTAPTDRPLVLSPFRGLRYAADQISDLTAVTSPPYDVLDRETVAALAAAEPHNIVRVILPRPAGPADWTTDRRPPASEENGREHYQRAAALFARWREDGVLRLDGEPALYVYEQRTEARTGRPVILRGLLGAVGLRQAEEGVILPHEDVLPGPVADRLALMSACAANLEPILLVYDGGGMASELVEAAVRGAPLIDARATDGSEHRVWRISDPAALAAIAADLAPRQALIADGHHRYATYLRLQEEMRATGAGAGPWDSGLALLVDQRAHPLELTAIHRTVSGVTLADVNAAAAKAFRIDSYGADATQAHAALTACRGERHGFLLTDGKQWELLSLPLAEQAAGTSAQDGTPAPGAGRPSPEGEREARLADSEGDHLPSLDTEVLHDMLLGRILGLSENQIGYDHTEAAAAKRARDGEGIAILLNPVDVATVQAVARAGGRMPRKSTSFGPKPRTGFVMRAFEEHEPAPSGQEGEPDRPRPRSD